MTSFIPVKRRKPLIHHRIGDVEHVHVAGRIVRLDAEDFHLLEGWTLTIASSGYLQLQGSVSTRPRPHILLSRKLMNPGEEMRVDHISGDKLDNRKVNLRVCSPSENQHNEKPRAVGIGRYKGCYYNNGQWGNKRWVTYIQLHGKRRFVGGFLTQEEAAKAYNIAAREMFGEFARLNVIGQPGVTVSARSVG